MTPTIGDLVKNVSQSRYPRLRQCTIKKYRSYVVFYTANDHEVIIERILDGRHDLVELLMSQDHFQ
jgi:hypothetical protein